MTVLRGRADDGLKSMNQGMFVCPMPHPREGRGAVSCCVCLSGLVGFI
jgi:hypothetical protein